MRYELEIESSVANGLASLVSDTPAAANGNSLLSASLALKVGKLRTFILEKANAIVAAPYQCEMLQELNHSAAELATQLNIPMPPMVNNLLGVRVRLDEFDATADIPSGNGLAALHVDKPEMFIGMATMMVPGFEALDIPNQSEPVKIPADVLPIENLDIFVLMGDQTIGIAAGEQYAGQLGAFLDAEPQDNGIFFSLSYDMAKQLEIQTAMSEKFDIAFDDHHSSADEFTEAIRTTYASMLGQSHLEMRFTSEGMVVDSTISFK